MTRSPPAGKADLEPADSPDGEADARLSGISIARRAVDLGYPIRESLCSLLPLVDELHVNVGDADDGTWEAVQEIGDPRILPFRSTWNLDQPSMLTLSEETNKALERCTGEWAVYLQADEVFHEDDLPRLRAALQRYQHTRVESLAMRYLHFYGTYATYQDNPRRWYPRATRAVRTGVGVESAGDACAFMVREGTRLRSPKRRNVDVRVFHYGWVREPAKLVRKQMNLERLFHSKAWLEEHGIRPDADAAGLLTDTHHLRHFHGTHPEVMRDRITAAAGWEVPIDVSDRPQWLRRAGAYGGWFLDWLRGRAARVWARSLGRLFVGRT